MFKMGLFAYVVVMVMFASRLGVSAAGEYENLRVLCVGCSSGMGRATAEILLKGGAMVVVTSRSLEKSRAVVKDFPQTGLGLASDAGDFTKYGDMVGEAKKFFKGQPITGLQWLPTGMQFGMYSQLGAAKASAAIDDQMKYNVYGVLHMMDLIKDDLIATEGSVVLMSSVVSSLTGYGFFPYSIGKAAMDSMMKNLATELGPFGVRVNAVNPASIETGIAEKLTGSADAGKQMYASMRPYHLMGRTGRADEVAHLMAFLVSDKCKFLTGETFKVDGGMSLMNPIMEAFGVEPENDYRYPFTRKWVKPDTDDWKFKNAKKKEHL